MYAAGEASGVSVRNCTFRANGVTTQDDSNDTSQTGGALFATSDVSLTVMESRFVHNFAAAGGGVHCCGGEFYHTEFIGGGTGGAVSAQDWCRTGHRWV